MPTILYSFPGNVAKMCFDKLRKRYIKKKNDAKKAKKSGSSTRESEKAEKHLKLTSFCSGWTSLFMSGKVVRVFDESQSDDEEKEDHFENSRATSVISPTNSRASSITSPTLPSKKNTTSSKRKADTSIQAANKKKGERIKK